MSSFKLRQELLTDPDARGYSGMTDAAIFTLITDPTIMPLADLPSLTSAEIYEAIVRSEFTPLGASEKQELQIILGLGGDIDISVGSKARTTLAAMFGGASATALALLALVQGRTQSIVQAKGIRSDVDEDMIAAARIPDQP